MSQSKPHVLFLSASSAVFDTIPEECYTLFSFHLLRITHEHEVPEKLTDKDLIIIDTYSLGVDFLDRIAIALQNIKRPILIIDDFNDDIIIQQLYNKGAKGYLKIDEYSTGLKQKMQNLISIQHTFVK